MSGLGFPESSTTPDAIVLSIFGALVGLGIVFGLWGRRAVHRG